MPKSRMSTRPPCQCGPSGFHSRLADKDRFPNKCAKGFKIDCGKAFDLDQHHNIIKSELDTVR